MYQSLLNRRIPLFTAINQGASNNRRIPFFTAMVSSERDRQEGWTHLRSSGVGETPENYRMVRGPPEVLQSAPREHAKRSQGGPVDVDRGTWHTAKKKNGRKQRKKKKTRRKTSTDDKG